MMTMMKRFATFALVVCLVVLAVAIVLGTRYPDIQQDLWDFFGGIVDGVGNFFGRLFSALRTAG